MLIDMTAETLSVSPQTLLAEINSAFNHGRQFERDAIIKFINDTWVHPNHVSAEWVVARIAEGIHDLSE